MATDLLHSLGVLVGDLCGAPSSQEQQVLFDVQLARWLRSLHALKKRQDDGLNVAILALAKSGKSTLLNALVGADLLPMNNVPETACICKVVHDPGASEPFLLEASPSDAQHGAGMVVTAKGEAAVQARLQHLNQAARGSSSGVLLQTASSLRALRTLSPSSLSAGSVGGLAPIPSLPTPTAPQAPSEGGIAVGRASMDSCTDNDAHVTARLAAQSAPAVATGLPADKMLSIHIPIAALLEYEKQQGAAMLPAPQAPPGPFAGPWGGSVRLQFLDTPGPNEAGEEGLKHQVARLLDGVDAAVYVLDYTKLKTDDEAGMFERLTHINPALVKRLSQRMFFVVNKVDVALVSEGQDLGETRVYVAELVTRQIHLEGFCLRPEQVLLTSARNALLSRLVLRGKAGADARQRFVQLAFGRFANPAMIPQEQLTAAAHALLADSGLQEFESQVQFGRVQSPTATCTQAQGHPSSTHLASVTMAPALPRPVAQVLAYLHTHAASVKHLALVDDIGRLLAEVRNVTAVCEVALTQSASCLAAHVGEVRAQLAHTLEQFEAVTRNTDTMGDELSREVRLHLQALRSRLYSAIVTALDTEGATALAGPAQPPSPSARGWQRVRERFLSMFTSPSLAPRTNIVCTTSGSVAPGHSQRQQEQQEAELLRSVMQATTPAARSRSKEELASLLLTLHEELTTQIHAEVREFWCVMEAVAAARHAELLLALNAHLAQLSQQVEAAVSRRLPVRLAPVDLSLQPPDASQFHADLDQLLSRGLVETKEKHLRVSQREVAERVRRHGICRWGDHWESVPRVRTVVEAYTMHVYELVPQEITHQFISMVDSAIEATQASLESYVSQFVHQQLSDARQQLREYSDSYLGVMSGALETSTRNSEHQTEALNQVRSFVQRLDTMMEQYESLRSSMEGTTPRAHQELDLIAFDEDDDDEGQEDEHEQQGAQPEGHLAPVPVLPGPVPLAAGLDTPPAGVPLPPARGAVVQVPAKAGSSSSSRHGPEACALPQGCVPAVVSGSPVAGGARGDHKLSPSPGPHVPNPCEPFASPACTRVDATASSAGADSAADVACATASSAAPELAEPSASLAPPPGPFDYGLAMSRAMSGSHLQSQGEEALQGEAQGGVGRTAVGLQHKQESDKSDEWDLV